TPLENQAPLNPLKCLKILCLFRLQLPKSELRISGGRELQLRSLQPLGLYVANSIFLGDYLTTKGQAAQADIEMIRDLGFTILADRFHKIPPRQWAWGVDLVKRPPRQ